MFMNIEPNTSNFVLKILLKVSFAALIVLNLSSLIWIDINPLSAIKPSYYLSTMTTWTTVTSVSAFNLLELLNWANFASVGGLSLVSVPSHYLNQCAPMDFESNMTNFVQKCVYNLRIKF